MPIELFQEVVSEMKSELTINQIKWVNLLVLYLRSSIFPSIIISNNLRAKPDLTVQTSKPLPPLWGLALKPPKLPIFALSAQSQNLSLPPSTPKSIPSPALDAEPSLITFALAPTTSDLKCPSLRSGYIHSVTAPGFLPRVPPFSSINFSLAPSAAQPNLNKALASVKQGALHKRWCQLAAWTDGTLCSEHVTVCVGACMPGCVNVVYMCHFDPGSINRQFSVGFEADFEVISWELLAKATALLEEEWHHGIERGDSIQQARFWMTETVNDCSQTVWSLCCAFYVLTCCCF